MLNRGGFRQKITEVDFKYTLDSQRKAWVMNMYPNTQVLVDIIQSIRWNEYVYNGEVVVSHRYYDVNEDVYNYNDETVQIIEETRVVVESQPTAKYMFLGGICYELMSDVYTNVDLSQFMDPTSDIDVTAGLPKITKSDSAKIVQQYSNPEKQNIIQTVLPFTRGHILNPYHAHYLRWIFDRIDEKISRLDINALYPQAVAFDYREYDIPANHQTPETGFNVKAHGNAYLLSFVEGDMMKVQLIIKIRTSDQYIIDHVLEVIVALTSEPLDYSAEWIDPYSGTIDPHILSIRGESYNIQHINTLINDNFAAYSEREAYITLMNRQYIHKGLNHVGRLLYLFDVLKHNKTDNYFTGSNSLIVSAFSSSCKELYNKMKKAVKALDGRILSDKEIVDTFVLKYFMLNASHKNYLVYDIKISDFIMAFVDVFALKTQKPNLGIYRSIVRDVADCKIDTPCMTPEYKSIMRVVRQNRIIARFNRQTTQRMTNTKYKSKTNTKYKSSKTNTKSKTTTKYKSKSSKKYHTI